MICVNSFSIVANMQNEIENCVAFELHVYINIFLVFITIFSISLPPFSHSFSFSVDSKNDKNVCLLSLFRCDEGENESYFQSLIVCVKILREFVSSLRGERELFFFSRSATKILSNVKCSMCENYN